MDSDRQRLHAVFAEIRRTGVDAKLGTDDVFTHPRPGSWVRISAFAMAHDDGFGTWGRNGPGRSPERWFGGHRGDDEMARSTTTRFVPRLP